VGGKQMKVERKLGNEEKFAKTNYPTAFKQWKMNTSGVTMAECRGTNERQEKGDTTAGSKEKR
ncbi:hypothetical protein RUM43_002602, partial [Polyplax serrata]